MNVDPKPSLSSALARYLPGFSLFRNYRLSWLIGDITAGISVCFVMIPSVVAYARLIGVPPQYGLYAALVPLVVYPFFGSSRQVIVGPDIAISLLMASAIAPLAAGDPSRAAALAGTIALLSGFMLLVGAGTKIGAVAEFLSKPVLVGYMTGAALILIASQFSGFFGIALKNSDFFPRLIELGGKLRQAHGPTVLLGSALLALLAILRRISPKFPVALVVCVVAIALSFILDLGKLGITMVGDFSGGLPAFAFPVSGWRDIHLLLPAAVSIALLIYTEAILLARAFAAKNGYEVQPNQELVGLGLANLLAGFFQGFAVTGSQARTTINDAAGGKTQVAGLVAAVTLVVFLLFLTPLLARLPAVALAAVLIFGGFTLVEFEAMKRIYQFYPRAGALAALTTLGVLAAGVIAGILIGVVVSLLGLINRVSHPPDAVLREVPGHGFHDLGDALAGQTIPGLIAYRFYAPLVFSNSTHFLERVHHLIAASPTPVRWFLLDAQAISDMDVTALESLRALHAELQQRGVALKIAHANRPLREILQRTGLVRELNERSLFDSVHECVKAFQASL